MLHWFLSTLVVLIHTASPNLKTYGLLAVFVLLFIESAGVIFAPGEATIVAAGFLSAKGMFSIWAVLPVAMIAATLGGYLAYWLGDRFGHRVLLRYGRYVGIKPIMVGKAHRFFLRFGAPVVLGGRFVVPLRQLQGYIAGTSEMGFFAFALWSAIGAILWVTVWGGGAYLLSGMISG
jgi:membrane protein DedA with SNARE-associated domain